MAGEWAETTVAEFAPFAYGKGLPETARGAAGPVAVYGSNGVIGRHDHALTTGPTVIIGRKGSVGAIHFSRDRCWPIDTTFFVSGPDEELVRFRYYALKALGLEHMNTDSAVPGLNREAAHARVLLVPREEAEQRAIARILGTLDDKIDLNRRMNETLEAIARGLFKSWFVDFDPVRAKVEGRDPRLPISIADHFPDRFEDSELGEIPAGWYVRRLGDLVELAYGAPLKEDTRKAGAIPVYGSNGQVGWHDEGLAKGPGIVVGRKGSAGKVTWVPNDFFAIDTTFYVVPRSEGLSLPFLFYALQAQDLASLGADSAVPGLNRNVAYMSLQMTPPPRVLEAFDRTVVSLFERVARSDEESRTLAALRSALLPKLISGELRVAPAERVLTGVPG